jgi:hypothetical protein
MKEPSTQWREQVSPDEEKRFAEYAAQFSEFQRKKSSQQGQGRALHRKQHLGLAARFEVLSDLPPHARHGLFATPKSYDAWVRLSNGGSDKKPDKVPDVRGLAIKILGVSGEGALGGPTSEQDFLLINHEAFSFPTSHDFIALAVNAAQGQGALLKHFVKQYGFFGAIGRVQKMLKTLGKPFSGFASEKMYSAAPVACGPYAVKLRLVPHRAAAAPVKGDVDLAKQLADDVRGGEIVYDLQLQFFVDEKTTPIEDASVVWPESEAPFVTVGRLRVLKQDPQSAEGQALSEKTEKGRFDPWNALREHRPLGEVMRARKVVYYESERTRGAV